VQGYIQTLTFVQISAKKVSTYISQTDVCQISIKYFKFVQGCQYYVKLKIQKQTSSEEMKSQFKVLLYITVKHSRIY